QRRGRPRHRRPGRTAPQGRPPAARSHGARRAMLTSPPPPPPSRADAGMRLSPVQRLHGSLKQEYQEFILQRIEEYKDNLPREQLLQLGDEAVRELQANAEGQYLLTEVLLLEHVDRIIARRLRLPAFARWRQKYRALREAQRQPTHWGLEADNPVARWTPRLEPGDLVVVVGASAFPCALFVAAHDFRSEEHTSELQSRENLV